MFFEKLCIFHCDSVGSLCLNINSDINSDINANINADICRYICVYFSRPVKGNF